MPHQPDVEQDLGLAPAPVHDDPLVVGAVGGMGPAATAEAFRRIVAATPAQRDQDHLHVIIDSDPLIPDRTRALLHGGSDPRPRLIAAARRLEAAGAQVLCMPCNTAHAIHADVRGNSAFPDDRVFETAAASQCVELRTDSWQLRDCW